MYLTITWVAILALMLYVWIHRKGNEKLPPSPFALPIIGHWRLLLPINLQHVTQLSQDLGGVFMLRFLGLNILFLNTSAAIKEALVNQSEVFEAKRKPVEPWMKESCRHGILFLDGSIWKEKRKFTMQHLRNSGFGKTAMEPIIMNEFKRMCVILDTHDGSKMPIKNFCCTTIFNVFWSFIAGKTCEHDDPLSALSAASRDIFEFGTAGSALSSLPGLKYLPGDPFNTNALTKCDNTLQEFVQKEIDEHSRTLADGEPRDYIDAYLMEIKKREGTSLADGKECYTQLHLRNAVVDMLNAATETTNGTLEWALLYLAVWPEIQDRFREELDSVIGRNRHVTTSDMPMLPYVHATIMEVQRVSSIVPFCTARITTKTTTLMNYNIPKGTIAVANFYAANRDKNTWPDPEVFRPERFMDPEKKAKTLDNWMSFSIGPRNCLGEAFARMEIFLLLTALIQRYSFHCVTGEAVPSIKPISGMTLAPRNFHLIVKLRP